MVREPRELEEETEAEKERVCTKTTLSSNMDEKAETNWKVAKKVLKIFLG